MNELSDIQNKLRRYKEEYPNIIEIWDNVISSRINLIEYTLKECNKVIELIENNEIKEDMEKNQILLLYLLKISKFFNTT
tara:strand:- start:344 stop:583 length:240 start_codon:yes stop_codon:yes gene_type:complete